jgi:hypothetical protein
MAKSDLLKEAIADAKAVKETALANAKIALQEAFQPRIKEMIRTKMMHELDNEDEDLPVDDLDAMPDDMTAPDAGVEDMDMGAEDMAGDDMGAGDVGDLSIDVDNNGEFDEFDIMSREDDGQPAGDDMAPEVNPEDEYNEGYESDPRDLDLESIIRELEGDLEEPKEEMPIAEDDSFGATDNTVEDDDMNIDEIIESILREDEYSAEQEVGVPSTDEDGVVSEMKEELAVKDDELQEAYNTVRQLKSIINEVNLLNAKLLYTNKLFRNFDLNESQKMKVIENFDRAGNTREVKLVFSTLAEAFVSPTKKRVVKESYASKAVATTKPSKPIISEGFDQAERWKKLAGLL